MILNIPTVNDGLGDFDELFSLWNKINRNYFDVTLDFRHCKFLRQNAVAFLGGLISYCKRQGQKVKINLDSLAPKVYKNLQENGFLYSFGCGIEPWQGNSIPYRQDMTKNHTNIVTYLQQ